MICYKNNSNQRVRNMPKLIKLNKYGTLALSIPKSIVEATGLKQGDNVEVKIKSVDPLIIAFTKSKPIEW